MQNSCPKSVFRRHRLRTDDQLFARRTCRGIHTDVVGIFPTFTALPRLTGSILIDQHDDWEAGDRRYFFEATMAELTAAATSDDEGVTFTEITAAQTAAS